MSDKVIKLDIDRQQVFMGRFQDYHMNHYAK